MSFCVRLTSSLLLPGVQAAAVLQLDSCFLTAVCVPRTELPDAQKMVRSLPPYGLEFPLPQSSRMAGLAVKAFSDSGKLGLCDLPELLSLPWHKAVPSPSPHL